jgi:glycosyltransferase involved in cell wall biosynthesis
VQERLPLYPGAADIRALARRQTCIAKRLVSLRKIVVPTQHMRTVLERHGVAAQRIACVPYGVDGVKRTVRNYLSVPAQPLRIGFIGTLRSHKGAHVLTAAFCTMPAGLANLVVYGREQDNPAYAAQLKRSVGTTAAVRFLDGFPNAEIGRVLSELDVLVVPSLWQENTPLVVHSALSARCPVVASRVAGISALIEHGKNGLLFEPGSATDLAEQLQLLVKDRGLLQTLSDQCKPLQTLQTYVDAMLALWSDSDGWLASNPVKNGG